MPKDTNTCSQFPGNCEKNKTYYYFCLSNFIHTYTAPEFSIDHFRISSNTPCLRRTHIVAADNRRKVKNVKIAKLWWQSNGKRGISKIRWWVETTFNDNTMARDEWLRQGMESSEQNQTLSGRWVTMSHFQHAENLPTNATDNFGCLWSLPDSSATTDGNTWWLAANSKLQFAA